MTHKEEVLKQIGSFYEAVEKRGLNGISEFHSDQFIGYRMAAITALLADDARLWGTNYSIDDLPVFDSRWGIKRDR